MEERSAPEPTADTLSSVKEALADLALRPSRRLGQCFLVDPNLAAAIVADARVTDHEEVLFEVGPGSNLPGLGKVETIKRENGRLVLVAKNGIITAMSEPRRPPANIPYRY